MVHTHCLMMMVKKTTEQIKSETGASEKEIAL